MDHRRWLEVPVMVRHLRIVRVRVALDALVRMVVGMFSHIGTTALRFRLNRPEAAIIHAAHLSQ